MPNARAVFLRVWVFNERVRAEVQLRVPSTFRLAPNSFDAASAAGRESYCQKPVRRVMRTRLPGSHSPLRHTQNRSTAAPALPINVFVP